MCECVCVCVCLRVGGIDFSQCYQCVCVHALFPSVHGFSLCIRPSVCVVSVSDRVFSIVL